MEPRLLVQQLATPACLDAMRALVGGVTATELRHAVASDAALTALVEGLSDPNPRVRWWSIQVLDHLDEPRAIEALVPCLDDPVPRVRRNAAHALGCVGCKPGWDGALPVGAGERLAAMAAEDPNPKVRDEAGRALACATARRVDLVGPG